MKINSVVQGEYLQSKDKNLRYSVERKYTKTTSNTLNNK